MTFLLSVYEFFVLPVQGHEVTVGVVESVVILLESIDSGPILQSSRVGAYLCRMSSSTSRMALCALAAFMVLFGIGCNDSSNVSAPEQEIPIVDPDTTGAASLKAFEQAVHLRDSIGDTALLDHNKLKAAITSTIPGYNLEVDESNRFASELFAFTEAHKVFYNANEDYLELTLGDYADNPDFFRVNIQRHNLAQGVEISGIKDEKRTIPGLQPAGSQSFFTWSSFNKRKRIAQVYIGVNDRYFLTIEASGREDFLKMEDVANWIDWSGIL